MSTPGTPTVLRAALAQVPVRVGDLAGDAARVRAAMAATEHGTAAASITVTAAHAGTAEEAAAATTTSSDMTTKERP